jgi:hypothetical protein
MYPASDVERATEHCMRLDSHTHTHHSVLVSVGVGVFTYISSRDADGRASIRVALKGAQTEGSHIRACEDTNIVA